MFMDILTTKELLELINREEDLFVSIYMPTFRSGIDIRQNPIRFKQLLRVAESKLYSMGMEKAEIERFLKPASNLVGEIKFWQNQSDGLAFFIHSDGFNYFRLPFEFKESVTISNRIYIKPLLPFFTGNGQFNILALSKNKSRLFRCTRQNVMEVFIEGSPDSMFDMQVDDDPRTKLERRLSNPRSISTLNYSTNTQAQDNENDYERNELTRFFRALDAYILSIHEGENIPMVLAGVEYLIPIYREKSNYPNIVEDFISGNPETLSPEELHKKAWDIVEPIFNEDKALAEAKYKQYSGQNNHLYLNSLEEIIPAAYSGQIESLFIDKENHQWGKFESYNNQVELFDEEKNDAEDLIEFASLLTLSRGGKVFALHQDEIPDKEKIAAVLRF
jgi:hypothetical protein